LTSTSHSARFEERFAVDDHFFRLPDATSGDGGNARVVSS
jgi:hypothetical protein